MNDTTVPKPSVLRDPATEHDLDDWGAIPTMIEGESRTSGKLLYKGPEGSPESGVWVCTPGCWECEVTRDEFCHFLSGSGNHLFIELSLSLSLSHKHTHTHTHTQARRGK